MTQDDGSYDLTPIPPPSAPQPDETPQPPKAKPGDLDWVPPTPIIEKADPDESVDEVPETPPDPDAEKNKGAAILGYFVFVLPLILAPNSPFARFHANQGLLVLILTTISIVLVTIMQLGKWLASNFLEQIPILHWFIWCLLHLLQPAMLIGCLALAIFGIIQAYNGKKKPIPLFGQWQLIK